MTLYELALRDLKKAQISLEHALKKPNVTETEINNLSGLVSHRKEILNVIEQRDGCNSCNRGKDKCGSNGCGSKRCGAKL